ncbi:Panacea domain-containing protein [Methanobacterium spitsbergense]|uniref:SocA family protein n=1 Tax=Methanobacterium spitsbergense TaxID=2874285 RepID=A0A8T5USF9_9EURY|nr:Panacea domain-containing protein [Methanobacterium spitsbergense]MBZ2166634.1 SocA family protein [Methanobacterium spitsbergense]
MEEFNKEKFKAVLHFIINECGHKQNFGRTVLYKLLYFSDFDFYEINENKMTGESYRKIENGPAPVHFQSNKNELINEGKIKEFEEVYPYYTQFKYDSLETPSLSLLSEKEIGVIKEVINRCSDMQAGEISNYSHEDVPYIVTGNKKIIDYDFVFYRHKKFSVREYEVK